MPQETPGTRGGAREPDSWKPLLCLNPGTALCNEVARREETTPDYNTGPGSDRVLDDCGRTGVLLFHCSGAREEQVISDATMRRDCANIRRMPPVSAPRRTCSPREPRHTVRLLQCRGVCGPRARRGRAAPSQTRVYVDFCSVRRIAAVGWGKAGGSSPSREMNGPTSTTHLTATQRQCECRTANGFIRVFIFIPRYTFTLFYSPTVCKTPPL